MLQPSGSGYTFGDPVTLSSASGFLPHEDGIPLQGHRGYVFQHRVHLISGLWGPAHPTLWSVRMNSPRYIEAVTCATQANDPGGNQSQIGDSWYPDWRGLMA